MSKFMRDALEIHESLLRLTREHSQWSQETFGTDSERGPIFALKHLEKEAKEAYEAYAKVTTKLEGSHTYDYREMGKYQIELADCFLLLLDAMRRSSVELPELVKLAYDKLQVCKKRHYPKPAPGSLEAVEHDRASDDGMPVPPTDAP